MRRPAIWISSLGLVLGFYLFFLYIFSPARHELSRQPKIWISLSVCLGNATRLYHKVKDVGDHDSALLDGDGRGDFGDSGCLCTTCGLPPLSVHRGKN